MSKGSIFLIGPGYIGLEILAELLRDGYQVTTLVRRKEAATDLEKTGTKTVLGTLDNHDIIAKQAAASDVVIHTASADHLPSVEAVLDGIAQRAKEGKETVYIHTSGCSELADNSGGAYKNEKVYEDDKPEMIDALPDSAPHRQIDLAILRRRKELGTKAKISIVLPPVIYGVGKASGRLSIQIPTMARFALKHGWAGYAGKGKAVWGQVHVTDLARGYYTIMKWMLSADAAKVLENPYYFIENGDEYSWEEMAEGIGRALQKVGKLEDPKPREIPEDLYSYLFGEWSVAVAGENARNRANRLRALGWNCQEKSTFKSLEEDEVPILLAEKTDFTGYTAPVAS